MAHVHCIVGGLNVFLEACEYRVHSYLAPAILAVYHGELSPKWYGLVQY